MTPKPLLDINTLTEPESEEYYKELQRMTDIFIAYYKLDCARKKLLSQGLKEISANILGEMAKLAEVHREIHAAMDRKYGIGDVFRTIPRDSSAYCSINSTGWPQCDGGCKYNDSGVTCQHYIGP
jgi:hypothetical protein